MKSLPSHLFRTGGIASPSAFRRAHEGMRRDLEHVVGRRYTHPTFPFSWVSTSKTSAAAQKRRTFKPPRAIEIMGIELEVAGDDNAGGACTFTVSATGIDGWEDIEVEASDDTAFVRVSNFTMRGTVAANQEVVFTLAGSAAAWTAKVANLIVHYRHDRHAGQKPSSWDGPLALKSGVPTVAADVDSNFDGFDTDEASDEANDEDLRIEVFESFGRDSNHWHIPAAGRTLHSVDLYAIVGPGDYSGAETVTITKPGGGTTLTVKFDPFSGLAGNKLQGIVVGADQTDDDPGDPLEDQELEFGDGTQNALYRCAVLYWI